MMCLDYRNVQSFGRRRPSHYQQELGKEGGGLSRVRASLLREIRYSQMTQFIGKSRLGLPKTRRLGCPPSYTRQQLSDRR